MNLNTFVNYSAPGYSGSRKYGLNNLATAKKVILMPPGTTIDTLATAMTEAEWTTLRKNPMATRIHPYPLAIEFKPEDGKTIYQKAALSGNIPIREDVPILVFTYDLDPILAALLRKNNYKKWDVAFVDSNNNIMGWTPDGIKFQGLTTTSVHLSQMSFNDGSKAALNELTISLANPLEWNENPALILGSGLDWFPLNMEGTTGVNLSKISYSTTSLVISVNILGKSLSDPEGQLAGLAKADFIFWYYNNPLVMTAITMVDNLDGTYTFGMTSSPSSVDHVTLVPTASISVVAYNIEYVATTAIFWAS